MSTYNKNFANLDKINAGKHLLITDNVWTMHVSLCSQNRSNFVFKLPYQAVSQPSDKRAETYANANHC